MGLVDVAPEKAALAALLTALVDVAPEKAALAALLTALVVLLIQRSGPSCRVPPGPRPLPLIGNLHQFPRRYGWRTYKEWGDRYGDVVCITVLGKLLIILNSMHAVSDILEKKGAASAGRPDTVFACELAGFSSSPAVTNDMELHTKCRKLWAHALNTRASQEYWPVQIQETRKMMSRLIDTPDKLEEHIQRTIGAVLFIIAYGYQIQDDNDYFLRLVHKNNKNFAIALTPGAYMVDAFPALKHLPSWLPGQGYRQEAAVFRSDLEELVWKPFELLKAKTDAGTARPCFVAELLQRDLKMVEKAGEQEPIARSAAVLVAGGLETTVAAIHSFFLAMMLHPQVQSKAQAELDRVVGSERPPTLEDRDMLVYCSAICHEVLRWQPVAPLGVPRSMLRDEEYRGYLLPKGSLIIMNAWAILQNPKVYPSPEIFQPERFVSADGKSLQNPEGARGYSTANFGFGRRICAGSQVGEASLFAAVSTALWSFNISNPRGQDVKVVDVNSLYTHRFVHHPKTFACDIKPRSMQVVEILRNGGVE